jgi:hypothetical protein
MNCAKSASGDAERKSGNDRGSGSKNDTDGEEGIYTS